MRSMVEGAPPATVSPFGLLFSRGERVLTGIAVAPSHRVIPAQSGTQGHRRHPLPPILPGERRGPS